MGAVRENLVIRYLIGPSMNDPCEIHRAYVNKYLLLQVEIEIALSFVICLFLSDMSQLEV